MIKVEFENSRELKLVGIWHHVESDKAIILSHGFTGDKSEWGRFDKLADELVKVGFNVLRFDFAGCGESDDTNLTVAKQIDDLKSAIEYTKKQGAVKVGLIGHSLGALVSANCYSHEISAMVLWAPVTHSLDLMTDYTDEQKLDIKKKGYYLKTRDVGVRKKFVIDKVLVDEIQNIDTNKVFEKIKCPVLIIHGDKDQKVSLEDSKKVMNYLSADSELKIIFGADHDFKLRVDEFVKPAVEWFAKYV